MTLGNCVCVATLIEWARSLAQLKEYRVRRLMAKSAEQHPHANDVVVAGMAF